jgi:hypothetical protein
MYWVQHMESPLTTSVCVVASYQLINNGLGQFSIIFLCRLSYEVPADYVPF